ncbi:MAG: hypothetical protein Q4A75_05415 [Peptostreptococcaceae bacterium]|nr:hypothetical protein [Peptostreptococcaceae bacterium]
MANILKVTTPPSTTYNNTVKGSPQTTPPQHIKNPVDLQRITRQDTKDDQSFGRQSMHYMSNYNKFLENVKDAIPMTDIMQEVFGSGMEGLIRSPRTSPEMTKELTEFMEMIRLSSDDLSSTIKDRLDNATGFRSALFDVLRKIMSNTYSVDLKADILKFAKRFNDMASNQRILGEIARSLRSLSQAMPRSEADTLIRLTGKLDLNAMHGDTSANLKILTQEILPMLSKYISRTNDLGKSRDLMSLLSLNISRYENGTKDNVLSSLKNLTMYGDLKEKLGPMDEKTVEKILDRLLTERSTHKDPLADKLSGIIDKALSGQVGYESRAAFEHMARSILVNESVYMPLIYSLLPSEVNGKQLFSEMWIDPDDGGHAQYSEEDRVNRVYLKFNIQDLGSFDMIMNMQKGKVDLQLFCPQEMDKDFYEIRNEIGKILEKNDLQQNNIYIEKNIGKIALTEIFPKIKEGRNNINVSV